ncbi:hypothetical protein E4191_15840 [Paracoccus liaowanqingii]|uniref:Uncharacterized protein n=1 Tax=Paracoccus liaowanqingii TaxID=2560053 RepID=A0A4Y5SQ77_9RHOB|nr:hypothetical protein [Paracoccus liaowanqingii]QDA35647.1 hypothetical protein E4191_15840 [Paracoccus liaowanqingii]
MFVSTRQDAFLPTLSSTDWMMIMNALNAYGHNAEYRDLLQRLDRQMTNKAPWKPAGQITLKARTR